MHRLNPPAARRAGLVALAALAALSQGAEASVFGSLANFDVVNDTGSPAYGFEIEIEDAAYDHAGTISSVFGYDRVFSFISPDPGAVVRFGKPAIHYIAGFGARITYGGQIGSVFTPSAPFVTGGESCWPGANPSWTSTSCDHFGVSTYGAPAITRYSWLVDDGSGALVKRSTAVPAVNIVYTPPPPPPVGEPPAPAPPPVLRLDAPDLGGDPRANAFWVKITKTTLEANVDLGDLLAGQHPGARPEIAALETETEIEWQVLQLGFVDEVSKVLDAPTPSTVYKFAFYKYLGRFDDDGLVDPKKDQFPVGDQLGEFVGDFVGQQIAGYNAQEVAAAVPEPGSWALMLGGLAGLAGWRLRRRRA